MWHVFDLTWSRSTKSCGLQLCVQRPLGLLWILIPHIIYRFSLTVVMLRELRSGSKRKSRLRHSWPQLVFVLFFRNRSHFHGYQTLTSNHFCLIFFLGCVLKDGFHSTDFNLAPTSFRWWALGTADQQRTTGTDSPHWSWPHVRWGAAFPAEESEAEGSASMRCLWCQTVQPPQLAAPHGVPHGRGPQAVPMRSVRGEVHDEGVSAAPPSGAPHRWASVQVRALRQELQPQQLPQAAPEAPHRRAVHLRGLRCQFPAATDPHRPRADPHWREPFLVWGVWPEVSPQGQPEKPHHPAPPERKAFQLQGVHTGLCEGLQAERAHANPHWRGALCLLPVRETV